MVSGNSKKKKRPWCTAQNTSKVLAPKSLGALTNGVHGHLIKTSPGLVPNSKSCGFDTLILAVYWNLFYEPCCMFHLRPEQINHGGILNKAVTTHQAWTKLRYYMGRTQSQNCRQQPKKTNRWLGHALPILKGQKNLEECQASRPLSSFQPVRRSISRPHGS